MHLGLVPQQTGEHPRQAQARIVDVHTGRPPYLVLRLRHPAGQDHRALAEACAKRIFEGDHDALPAFDEQGRTEHVFFATRVPASIVVKMNKASNMMMN